MGRKRKPEKVLAEFKPLFIEYIKEHSNKVKDSYIWNTYPICVVDVCVDCIQMKDDTINFGYEIDNIFKKKYNIEDFDPEYLNDILEDMKAADNKKKK